MLSFNLKSILVAAAAFASLVSAVPTPDTSNSLNIDLGGGLGNYEQDLGSPDRGGLLVGLGLGNLNGDNGPVKRGGSSCKEIVQKCHDGIALIVIKIS